MSESDAILAKLQTRKSTLPPGLQPRAQLHLAWKRGMAEISDTFTRDLTGREKGELDGLLRKYPKDALRIVYAALEDWSGFKVYVESKAERRPSPAPTTASLLFHADEAMQLVAKGWPAMSVDQITMGKFGAPVAMPTEVAKKADHVPASVAEALAILGQNKGLLG